MNDLSDIRRKLPRLNVGVAVDQRRVGVASHLAVRGGLDSWKQDSGRLHFMAGNEKLPPRRVPLGRWLRDIEKRLQLLGGFRQKGRDQPTDSPDGFQQAVEDLPHPRS